MTLDQLANIQAATFEDAHLCRDCEWHRTWKEERPWGDTVAYEPMRDCVVPEWEECPGVEKVVEEEQMEGLK